MTITLTRFLKRTPIRLDEGVTITKDMYERIMNDSNFRCGVEIEFNDPGIMDTEDGDSALADKYADEPNPLFSYLCDEMQQYGFEVDYNRNENTNDADYDASNDDMEYAELSDLDYDELISQTSLRIQRSSLFRQGGTYSSSRHGRKLVIDSRINELYAAVLGDGQSKSPRDKFYRLKNWLDGSELQTLLMLHVTTDIIDDVIAEDHDYAEYEEHPLNDVDYYHDLSAKIWEAVPQEYQREEPFDYDGDEWKFVTDSSTTGGELVSPPMGIKQALKEIRQAFDILTTLGMETGSNTGFHVGMSYGGFSEMNAIDRLKLIMLLDEEYVLNLFARMNNTFTRPHITSLRSEVKDLVQNGGDPSKELEDLMISLSDRISNEKKRAVNFSKLESGYLEFRIIGDTNYMQRYDEIAKQIIRFAAVLYAAYDPDQFKQKYYKTLYKMLHSSSLETSKEYDKSDGGVIANILLRNARSPRLALKAYNDFTTKQQDDTLSSDEKRKVGAVSIIELITNSM